jgi:hypothetical protein
MQRLTPENWRELFDSVEQFAYHLEMRDSYGVDDEAEEFAQWKTGALRLPTTREDWWDHAWHDLVRDAVQRGAVLRRTRIVSEPVTDYIRFEWEGTYQNIEAGEDVRWLPRRLATGIALPGNDFWLFDDRTVLVNHFTGNGGWLGNELITDPAVIKLCHTAFDSAWELATPHDRYQPG